MAYDNGSISVTREYLKSHPDVVKAFLQGYRDGWQFVGDPANKAAVKASISKWLKVDDKVAEESYEYLYPLWTERKLPTVDAAGVKTLLGLLTKNPKAATAQPNQFFDNSILQSLGK